MPATPARGSDEIPRTARDDGDKATRKMEADQFRALLRQEESRKRSNRAPTVQAADEMMSALVAQTAQTDADDADLAIACEESRPFAKQAPLAPVDRVGAWHASEMAPLENPPQGSGVQAVHPPAPASVDRMALVIMAICIALLALTIVLTLKS